MKTALSLSALPPVALALAMMGCEPPQLDTRTFPLGHINGHEAAEVITPYVYEQRDARYGGPGRLSYSNDAITVRETAENVERIAQVLAEIDVPRPDIELRFRLIEADGFTDRDPRIAAVEDELRRYFQFGGYRLVGETLVTAADGADIAQGFLGAELPYPRVAATAHRVGPSTVRLGDVTLWTTPGRQAFTTTVNVRPGQTIVLGSAPQEGDQPTLLLTVTAETGDPGG
jgi:hypothetical protein